MPVFSIADDHDAKQRLGDAINNLPIKTVTVTDTTGEKKPRHIEPAWASAYHALMFGPEAVRITDPDEASAFEAWAAKHAPGALVVEHEPAD